MSTLYLFHLKMLSNCFHIDPRFNNYAIDLFSNLIKLFIPHHDDDKLFSNLIFQMSDTFSGNQIIIMTCKYCVNCLISYDYSLRNSIPRTNKQSKHIVPLRYLSSSQFSHRVCQYTNYKSLTLLKMSSFSTQMSASALLLLSFAQEAQAYYYYNDCYGDDCYYWYVFHFSKQVPKFKSEQLMFASFYSQVLKFLFVSLFEITGTPPVGLLPSG